MHYDAELSFVFNFPTKVIFGPGSVSEAAMEASRLGMDRILLVSDRVIAEKTDILEQVARVLGQKVVARFLDVPADSGVEAVEKGFEVGRDAGAQGVVSVGGGSVIDTGKGICLLLREGGRLRDYEGFQNLTRKVAPHIVIPTTAGTGSEVTYVAVIKDHEAQRKLLFGDYHLIPDVAILDPKVTVGLPAHLTAATGMDALSHAIEALHSLQHEPIADALALHAIRLLRASIPRSVKAPEDLEARGQQLIAACIAGAAFSNAQVGLVHAMAHTVGARFGVHHGLANSICMPAVIRFNAPVCGEIYREVARAFEAPICEDPIEQGDTLASALRDFAASLGLETSLRSLGVPCEALEELAEATLFDGALVYNGRPVGDAAEIIGVWEQAWEGS